LGSFDQTEAISREMIARNPMNSQEWNFLAFDRASAVTQNYRTMLREIPVKVTSQANRADLLFAYAEMLRKNVEYEASFAALKDANDLTLAEPPAVLLPTWSISASEDLGAATGASL